MCLRINSYCSSNVKSDEYIKPSDNASAYVLDFKRIIQRVKGEPVTTKLQPA